MNPGKDIERRADEIRGLIASNRLSEATQCLLDLATDFSDRETRAEAFVLSAKLSQLFRDEQTGKLDFEKSQAVLTRLLYSILELTDEIVELHELVEPLQAGVRDGDDLSPAEEARLKRLRAKLLKLVNELDARMGADDVETTRLVDADRDGGGGDSLEHSVFISYNHTDGASMRVLVQALRDAGVEVWVDRTHLVAGESIETFIRRAIQETTATLSLVSSRSLLSDWVAMETLGTLAAETSYGRHRLIAGYLDGEFFDPGFRLTATDHIDERLAEIDRLAVAHRERQLDTRDLDHQRNRLVRLRNGLGDILDRFRKALMVDLREIESDPAAVAVATRAIVRGLDAQDRG